MSKLVEACRHEVTADDFMRRMSQSDLIGQPIGFSDRPANRFLEEATWLATAAEIPVNRSKEQLDRSRKQLAQSRELLKSAKGHSR